MAMTDSVKTNRADFRGRFGRESFDVVERLDRGWTTKRVADTLSLPETVVAAYAANYTRGTYDNFLPLR